MTPHELIKKWKPVALTEVDALAKLLELNLARASARELKVDPEDDDGDEE
ncbi:MAG TPA: hypothetical protein VGQ97_06865 [Xanthobacteraceae bacterium]|nr:hypothetical protein [Xanthobacteraceae bacterium]